MYMHQISCVHACMHYNFQSDKQHDQDIIEIHVILYCETVNVSFYPLTMYDSNSSFAAPTHHHLKRVTGRDLLTLGSSPQCQAPCAARPLIPHFTPALCCSHLSWSLSLMTWHSLPRSEILGQALDAERVSSLLSGDVAVPVCDQIVGVALVALVWVND